MLQRLIAEANQLRAKASSARGAARIVTIGASLSLLEQTIWPPLCEARTPWPARSLIRVGVAVAAPAAEHRVGGRWRRLADRWETLPLAGTRPF